MPGHLLGIDVGSSFVKTSLVEAASGKIIAAASSPEKEMPIDSPRPGWAQQDPEVWWGEVRHAVSLLGRDAPGALRDVRAVGISYQMHGLVLVDRQLRVLRPSIIWCDSRAVPIGERAFSDVGREACLRSLLNSPGNFTASKLVWVRQNEPEIFGRIHKAMLPGDFIAMKMTDRVATTIPGISEMILWDYPKGEVSKRLLDYFGISPDLIPDVVPTFSIQGEITERAAAELGLKAGIPVSYRAGDQPNNAFSLGVAEPGQIAATAGTSGVVYGVSDSPLFDPHSRVNTFVHVTHDKYHPRYGILLCVNGTGIANSWIKDNVMTFGTISMDYGSMNEVAASVPVGSCGLVFLPFGNGAERTLGDRMIGASIHFLDFNTHTKAHMLRAAQEGIVFALAYGLSIMTEMGIPLGTIRAPRANMFQSPVFTEAFAAVTGCAVQLMNTDGAAGAARGAGLGAGIYQSRAEAFAGLEAVETIEPAPGLSGPYREAYERWERVLMTYLDSGR